MNITEYAYPRAALIGNPSDGYYGKTIAFVFDDFRAAITLEQSNSIIFQPNVSDVNEYRNQKAFESHLTIYGYYGGIRLLKAAFKKFVQYCRTSGQKTSEIGFAMSYTSDIPIRLGFAGSSAIITSAIRALCRYYQVSIPPHILANVVLSVEQEELNIDGGLQDRVAQAFEYPVAMDFGKSKMKADGFGTYSTIDKELLPPLYIAYIVSSAEGSEVVHNDLRERFLNQEPAVVVAMKKFRDLTDQFYLALQNKDLQEASILIDNNFDLRRSIMPIAQRNLEMIEMARRIGASAKFTGSGGAIIGTYSDDDMYNKLKRKFNEHDIECLKPNIVGV